jgi:hypothetical protein
MFILHFPLQLTTCAKHIYVILPLASPACLYPKLLLCCIKLQPAHTKGRPDSSAASAALFSVAPLYVLGKPK